MKTTTINLYDFAELSDQAKSKALSNYDGISNSSWWEDTYRDAKDSAGLEINSFDIDRKHIEGNFIKGLCASDSIELILENCGADTNLYLLADEYRKLLSFDIENEELMDKFREEYLEKLLKIYLKILSDELDYILSDEYKIEMFGINNYTFEANGTMRNF